MIFTKPSGPYPRGRKSSKKNHDHTNNNGCFLSVPSQFVLEGRYSALRQGNRAGKSCAQHQYKEQNPNRSSQPILANTLGMVMNISAGPACKVSGSPPENANTAGMIIRPAIMAIAVSKHFYILGGTFDRYVLFHIRAKRLPEFPWQ